MGEVQYQGRPGCRYQNVRHPDWHINKKYSGFPDANDDDDAIDDAENPDGLLYQSVVVLWVSSELDHVHHLGLHIDLVVQ